MTQTMSPLDLALPIPEVKWRSGDDLCDCTFQRIGDWTNPYIARTLRVRLCCIWKKIYAQFPDFVEEISAYWHPSSDLYISEQQEWDSEDESMPRWLWHRQVAFRTGKTLAKVRDELYGKAPPGPVPPGTGRKTAHLPRREE